MLVIPGTNRKAALLSFRLGGTDGVSIEAAKWSHALRSLGFDITTVAGEGPVEHRLVGLAMGATDPPSRNDLEQALMGVDLVVVENLCSLPLNPAAWRLTAACLAGRPAILRHHDLAWQRPHLGVDQPPPDDPAWVHVCINDLSKKELADRGITATRIYNSFDTDPAPGRRQATREAIGLSRSDRLLVLQPTRAIARKRVDRALALAEALDGAYWLLGPAEDGYESEVRTTLQAARVPVKTGLPEGCDVADAYAACDLVAFPSTWEGFGNPALESAIRRRPLAIGDYPVARELAAFGFDWFGADDVEGIREFFARGDQGLIEANFATAARHFASEGLPTSIRSLIEAAGWWR